MITAYAGHQTVALLASGGGYLLLSPALAWVAFVSLSLLLVWVTGTGVALGWDPEGGLIQVRLPLCAGRVTLLSAASSQTRNSGMRES